MNRTSEYIGKTIAFVEQNPLESMILITFHHEYLDQRKNGETFDEYMDRQYQLAVTQEAEDLQKNHEEASDYQEETEGYY